MRYNAGSEIYSQILCQKLADKHIVNVFTRLDNPFAPDYSLHQEVDEKDSRVKLHLINLPLEKHRYQYQIPEVDQQFSKIIKIFQPDIVHIGHLHHLSISIVNEIPQKTPIIYTLHDYWLMCPRGQFIQQFPYNIGDAWAVCDKQENLKCATHCYFGNFSGAAKNFSLESNYWGSWVQRRMEYIKTIRERIDYFIAPSKYLLNRYCTDFGVPREKLIYLDYGFELARLKGRCRTPNEPFTFGYIGTHIPAKGIQLLIKAFGKLKGKALLRIWGRSRGENTKALQSLAHELPRDICERIEWLPEYDNQQIVRDVFNNVDVIVVPSIWMENSPLVIHEALQARIPVITANAGGMSEYIHHNVNGLLFKHRDYESLVAEMQVLLDHPEVATKLGAKGYLGSRSGDVIDINEHVLSVENIYEMALSQHYLNNRNKRHEKTKWILENHVRHQPQ